MCNWLPGTMMHAPVCMPWRLFGACGIDMQSPNVQETVQEDAVKAVFPYGQVHLEVGCMKHSSCWTRLRHSSVPNADAARSCRSWKAVCAVRVASPFRSWVSLLWPAASAMLAKPAPSPLQGPHVLQATMAMTC